MANSSNIKTKDLEIKDARKGDITGRNVTILEEGSVTGGLSAQSVVIRGIVKGIVLAREIIVRSTARVEGELKYQTLAVDHGACLEAKCMPS